MKALFRLLCVGVIAALVGFTGNPTEEPPCQCQVTVHKQKRTGRLPCIVGILRDSTSQKPLSLAVGVVVDEEMYAWTNKESRAYCEVRPGTHAIVAKAFTCYSCPQQVTVQDGDSIVCVFDMRQAPSDGPEDFIHKTPRAKRK